MCSHPIPQPLRFKELAYRFRVRRAGESKVDSVMAWDYVMLLLDKLVGRWIPARFLAFSIVGAVGVAVHFAILTLVFQGLHRSFVAGQAIATLGAMTFNYAVNNALTYRDMRLRGLLWLRGWASFVLACSIGGAANLGVASMVYGLGPRMAPRRGGGNIDRGGLELCRHDAADVGPAPALRIDDGRPPRFTESGTRILRATAEYFADSGRDL